MIYGPFSLADATDAVVDFYLWLNSELFDDYLRYGASLDGSTFYVWGLHGYSGGWMPWSFDLTDVGPLGNLCGQSQVWIAFIFQSGSTTTYPEGARLDDIVLRKCTSSSCPTAISEVEPIPEGTQIVEMPATLILKP